MRWRRNQGFELPQDEREGAGLPDTTVMRGDELPLVSSPQPHLSSSASSSLSSTHLSTLEDSTTSSSSSATTMAASKMDPARAVSLTALPNNSTSSPVIMKTSTPKDSLGHRSHPIGVVPVSATVVIPGTVPVVGVVAGGTMPSGVMVPAGVRSPARVNSSVVRLEEGRNIGSVGSSVGSCGDLSSSTPILSSNTTTTTTTTTTTITLPSCPNNHPTSTSSSPQHHKTPSVSPVRVAVSPTKSPANGHVPARPPSGGTPHRTSNDAGGVVVLVKNDPLTTTVTVDKDPKHYHQHVGTPAIRSNSTASTSTVAGRPCVRRNSSVGGGGGGSEGRKATHEKSKSVTIVVNDQQVSYNSPSNSPQHYHHNNSHHHLNGTTANGAMVIPGHHQHHNHHHHHKGDTEASTRPSSAASSFQTSAKVDPDIQVRPLVGWGGVGNVGGGSGGGEGSSVVEDAASSDDCHRSTLTLVHSPARTYLSGDGEGGEGGAAWGGSLTSLCGITMVLGAALWLRLPQLIYQYGAGSFLAAWAGVVVLVAVPLSYLEASLAQFSSSAALALWRLVPIARGVGWSTVVVCLYWAVVVLGYLAPLLHYLILALHPPILQGEGGVMCPLPRDHYNNTGDWLLDQHSRCVYDLPSGWDGKMDLTFSWPLLACTATATLLAALTGMCGPRTIATVTTTTTVFAVIGVSLQLALGLMYVLEKDVTVMWETLRPFLLPQLSTLLQPEVWCAAVSQALLSLGLGGGLLMSFSSHASFRFPLRRHLCGLIFIVILVTLVLATVVVIQLTLLATDRHLPVHHALSSIGTSPAWNAKTGGVVGVNVGVAVISASHLINVLIYPVSWLQQVVSFFIYVGLWSSGVTTCVGCVHTLVAALSETWDCLPRPAAALLLAPFLMALALPTTTRVGSAAVSLVDEDVLRLVLLWPPVTLTLAITTIYGIHKVRKDFTFMLEAAVSWLWAPVWGILLPLLLLGVLVWLCVMDGVSVAVLKGPGWRIGAVWGLRAAVMLPVPITAIYIIKSQLAYGVVDKVASSLQSSREWGDWGPQDPIEHHNWRRWREDETRPITSLKRRLATRPLTYTHSTLSSESSSTLTRLRSKYQRNGGPPSLL